MATLFVGLAQLVLALAICVGIVVGVMLLTVVIYRAGVGDLLDETEQRRKK